MWIYTIVLIAVLIIVVVTVRSKKSNKISSAAPKEIDAKAEGIFIAKQYIPHTINQFLNTLSEILPPTCVAFPYVRVSKILNYIGSKPEIDNLFKEVVDVCIFSKDDMVPVLVIDLVDFSLQNAGLKEQKKELVKIFRSINMPYVKILTLESYDLTNLKNTILMALPKDTADKLQFLKQD